MELVWDSRPVEYFGIGTRPGAGMDTGFGICLVWRQLRHDKLNGHLWRDTGSGRAMEDMYTIREWSGRGVLARREKRRRLFFLEVE